MGFRFRKSVNFGPLRVNASKSGLGWSVGVPGARYTKMANGRTRTTASIPGTGISWVEESKKTYKTKQPEPEKPKKMTRLDLFCLITWEILKVLFRVGLAVLFIILVCAASSNKKGA